jgi:hypothetical protein
MYLLFLAAQPFAMIFISKLLLWIILLLACIYLLHVVLRLGKSSWNTQELVYYRMPPKRQELVYYNHMQLVLVYHIRQDKTTASGTAGVIVPASTVLSFWKCFSFWNCRSNCVCVYCPQFLILFLRPACVDSWIQHNTWSIGISSFMFMADQSFWKLVRAGIISFYN